MTELLEKAIEHARTLSPQAQDDIARFVLGFASKDQSFYELTAEEEAEMAESLGQAERREFASDAQIAAIWAKHGL